MPKAPRNPADLLVRFRSLFYRMSITQNRYTLLRDMLYLTVAGARRRGYGI